MLSCRAPARPEGCKSHTNTWLPTQQWTGVWLHTAVLYLDVWPHSAVLREPGGHQGLHLSVSLEGRGNSSPQSHLVLHWKGQAKPTLRSVMGCELYRMPRRPRDMQG